ncbi:6-pyruvoyltetrahydropterin/6-carboxytetrahydropterin synthase [Pontibacter ummariensis]|uniref:6-carboxy-5,6,7,8-tetrahydropterin synthase n=1 Tax=Pontibacter ummariensis TaxID=1610492 RepID=A0A239F7D0_9BACT|nr:6-carboxytetrahydropterin synthase [Pontibacter ummariensis]PRY12395.1 6-pyruvoyltetrahydropterin/6-carboxytetrahydropterin synthase [Pontibacter ummariensis]SNS52707.1 6-pyruvoyltetrahydropterin/6-carboxytetrahydropterin synthase [Pontibacter ummariensis]
MTKIRLTRRFTFEAAHALLRYDGPCRHIHGHSYKLEVTVIGTPLVDEEHPKNGMVMDFGDLKQIVQEHIIARVDHALLLRADSSKDLKEALRKTDQKLLLTPYQPTCENMLIDFKTRLLDILPAHVTLHSLKLWETENAFAEWYASDN